MHKKRDGGVRNGNERKRYAEVEFIVGAVMVKKQETESEKQREREKATRATKPIETVLISTICH